MKITVKYFGIIADIAQKKEEVFISDNDSLTLNELQQKIEIIYSKMLDINYSIAVDKKIITNCDVVLNDQNEVALLPPFAGG